MLKLTPLPDRGVIAVEGDDRVAFLQGLVSNDMEAVRPGHAVWAALLTAQGKWLADFFVFSDGSALLLDCEAAHIPMLMQRLSRYRLRMQVSLRHATGLHVYVAWDGVPALGGVIAPDPRLPGFAWRILASEPLVATAVEDDWDRLRLAAGLPDGSKDMEPDRSVLLEAGFDELAGVSWSKGCYMGQELTARTRYRGLVKQRLLPVEADSDLAPGPIFAGDVQAGEVRSVVGKLGLALIRLDRLADPLSANGQKLRVSKPDWVEL